MPARSRRRLGLQLLLLAALAGAFLFGVLDRADAGGPPTCPEEGACTFKKPNILFMLDYSTGMNELVEGQRPLTRWQLVVEAVETATMPGGFVSQNAHLAVMRFGHDPDPLSPGTSIPGEATGLVDGQVFDLRWDDEQGEYLSCVGQALADILDALPPPMLGAATGIEPWTLGAFDAAAKEIAQTQADHPEPPNEDARVYVNVLLTAGEWSNADGSSSLAPPEQDPAPAAAALFDDHSIPTYVVSVAGTPEFEAAADAVAAAGGTVEAIDGQNPETLAEALMGLLQAVLDLIKAPNCIGPLPRVMILLEASSAMLNVDGGASFGGPGETGWDQARAALSGEASIFTAELAGDASVEDLVHLGLAVYGHDEPAPGEHELLVQYGPCMRDNLAWALDPDSSCEAPGCEDPWAGPTIEWSFKDGSLEDPPGFDAPTRSHMPQCAGADACAGSGAFLHLGLELIAANQATYYAAASEPEAPFPVDPSTSFVNILVTRGDYEGYSTDAQVQAELEAMYAAGITTYVIAFGDGSDTPEALATLTKLAGWGSGGELGPYAADGQAELAATLVAILEAIAFDPCCAYVDCSENPEPTTGEPDPTPTTGEESTDTGAGETTHSGDTGAGDSSSGDGDTGDTTGTSSEGVGDEIGDETGSDTIAASDTLDYDEPTDEGCNCSAEAGGRRELALGFALLVLGLGRRRQRSGCSRAAERRARG